MTIFSFLFSCIVLAAQDYRWEAVPMDGTRTGCVAVAENNAAEAIGHFDRGTYIAPNGRRFHSSSSTARVAKAIYDVQPQMKRVKKVIAHSEEELYAERYETKLSNWFVDVVMDKVEKIEGKPVDVGICNFGGIRVNMPSGAVILDDMLSMFPFKNNLVYLELTGKQLKKIFSDMASRKFEAVGGARIIAENGKVISALIGGKPIEDGRYYGVATISFLLYGGDSLTLADGARNLHDTEVQIIDAVLEHLAELTASGQTIKVADEPRVTVK